mgnify:CR=1 FL=1
MTPARVEWRGPSRTGGIPRAGRAGDTGIIRARARGGEVRRFELNTRRSKAGLRAVGIVLADPDGSASDPPDRFGFGRMLVLSGWIDHAA